MVTTVDVISLNFMQHSIRSSTDFIIKFFFCFMFVFGLSLKRKMSNVTVEFESSNHKRNSTTCIQCARSANDRDSCCVFVEFIATFSF